MKPWLIACLLFVTALTIAGTTWLVWQYQFGSDSFLSPIVGNPKSDARPLNNYTIAALAAYQPQPSQITLVKELSRTKTTVAYLFTFTTLGKTMSGQVTFPLSYTTSQPTTAPIIIMLRGYVPVETYETGVGTRNAATAFAAENFITIAPDFFGFGQSDPEPADSWQARFEKPLAVIELYQSLQTNGLPTNPDNPATVLKPSAIGLWAHSNGGQIALTTLEALGRPIPTTLWAPVTAPFPYSVLFFSDESDDEGKAMRKWVSQFDRDYDSFEFSLTRHLDRLTGPLQLHQGGADAAIPAVWSDEFADKIKAENSRRQELTATDSAATVLPDIELTYYRYPGADHNLQPNWQTVVNRDIEFFKTELLK